MLKVCLAWRDRKDQQELMDHLGLKDQLDQMDRLETEEHLACRDQLDQLVQEEPRGHKENVEMLDHQEKKDPLANLDFKGPLVQWASEAKEEKRDPRAKWDPLALEADPVTRVPLAVLV